MVSRVSTETIFAEAIKGGLDSVKWAVISLVQAANVTLQASG